MRHPSAGLNARLKAVAGVRTVSRHRKAPSVYVSAGRFYYEAKMKMTIENNNFDPFAAVETDIPKHCPFCGTEPGALAIGEGDFPLRQGYWVACPTCGGSGPLAASEQEAVVKWNERYD